MAHYYWLRSSPRLDVLAANTSFILHGASTVFERARDAIRARL
jgi:hypothetical protein